VSKPPLSDEIGFRNEHPQRKRKRLRRLRARIRWILRQIVWPPPGWWALI